MIDATNLIIHEEPAPHRGPGCLTWLFGCAAAAVAGVVVLAVVLTVVRWAFAVVF
jgi:hypothetical protein